MTDAPSSRPAFRQAGTLLAFVLCAWAWASEARAGCAHYAVSALDRERVSALTGLGVIADLNGADLVTPLVPTRELPCSGPSCSKNPLRPDAPSPPTPVRSDSWCCTTPLLRIAAPESAGAPGEPISGHPAFLPSAPERPPRTSRRPVA